ncbi:MAG: nucleoside hydrolase [Thermodesulfobacteriota bacterium]|nr:nucleoside hydrolase [Thermodesulfobacteriota bacterium]
MIRRRYATLYLMLAFFLFAHFAHAHTYGTSVLVDTDMALDDIRAVAMLLNSHRVNIPLIVTSDGGVPPQIGCQGLARLLKYFKKDNIRIAQGKALDKPSPPWRSWSEDVKWPETDITPMNLDLGCPAHKAIVNTLKSFDGSLLYLCLGPLTNLAESLRGNPEVGDKISRLVYFGTHPDASSPGWNTARDPECARLVFDSGIEIYSMSLPREKLLRFDEAFYGLIKGMKTPTAHLIASIHGAPAVKKLLSQGHFYIWDEMTVIYLNRPSMFKFSPEAEFANVMSLKSFKAEGVCDAYLKLLGLATDFNLSHRHTVVLKTFPDDPLLFREDVMPHVEKIIEKYGLEEWNACLLTNEFHRHLGIYSLIGAKMGIRAREILEAPFDKLRVVSFAGNSPPLSCMNDGLQVATGASLGRGAIRVSDDNPRPAASFLYRDKRLTLTLKPAWLKKVKGDIKTAMIQFEGLNPEYFAHIRKLSIRYWLNLNREDIFEELIECCYIF